MTTPPYLPIERLIELIDEPARTILAAILADERKLFETVPGSTHNHQNWPGGYLDHVTETMNYAVLLHVLDSSLGRPLPFSLSDALLILFLHDLEKPWRIETLPDGTVRNRPELDSKAAHKAFREAKLAERGLVLTPAQQNALTYVEGEIADYSSKRRVMNELAAFCHKCDVHSARIHYAHPLPEGDGWRGAARRRTT
jgi:hypothetical protein